MVFLVNRLIFNVVDVGVRIPDSVQRLWGRGLVHYSFASPPSVEDVRYVEEVLKPDVLNVDQPAMRSIKDTLLPDTFDLLVNMYAHEVIDPVGDLLDSVVRENQIICYPVDIFYMWDETHYAAAPPLHPCLEYRVFPFKGDGTYAFQTLISGDNLVPAYVGELNSYGITVTNFLNYKLLAHDGLPTPPLKEWKRGGLPRI